LRDALGGFFTAQARGLLAREFVLRKDGASFGRLRISDRRGAELVAGELAATIERTDAGGYRMLADGLEITAWRADGADTLEVRAAHRTFSARVSFLRNTAAVRAGEGGTPVRVSGNVTGRRYEVTYDETEDPALPVALLLLCHVISLRRRVYLA
jgi:hypothetical protein